MRIVILGTAGYHPNEKRHTACVIIPKAGIVFDAGSSFFRLPQYLTTETIDIFLSHAHLDHVMGLTFLLDVQHQYPLQQVRVHGEEAKLQAIRRHLFAPTIFPVEPPFDSVPLSGQVSGVDGSLVSWIPLRHPGGSVGYRVDWPDRSLAYITDTTARPDAPYVDFVRGVDLLIHECNFPDGMEELATKTGHSSFSPVVALARQAEVGRLMLTHFNPLEKAPAAVRSSVTEMPNGPIEFAYDGLELEI